MDDQNRPSAFTTNATISSPASPTAVPVLTSVPAPGIASAQAGGVAPSDQPNQQFGSTEIVCRDHAALSAALAKLERGDCSATELAITPYAPGDEEMKRLAKALSVKGNRVDNLRLVTTGLDKEGFDALAGLLNSNSGLRQLGIIDCRGDDERPWQSLANTLAQNSTLESLVIHFSGSNRGLEERKSLYKALSTNAGLRDIKLFSCAMDAEASSLLANSLRANPRIEILHLNHASFRTGGEHAALMNEIASHPGLKQVSLGASLSQNDLRLLMTGLQSNKVLRALTVDFSNLSGRPHDSIFAHGACVMLKNNDTLQELSIRNHMLTDAGVWAISDALKGNHSLRKLDLFHTIRAPGPAITANSALSLSAMLDDNKVIQHIDIGFYEKGENGIWGMASASHPARQELHDKLAKNLTQQ